MCINSQFRGLLTGPHLASQFCFCCEECVLKSRLRLLGGTKSCSSTAATVTKLCLMGFSIAVVWAFLQEWGESLQSPGWFWLQLDMCKMPLAACWNQKSLIPHKFPLLSYIIWISDNIGHIIIWISVPFPVALCQWSLVYCENFSTSGKGKPL